MNIITMYNNYNCFSIFEELDSTVFFNFLLLLLLFKSYVNKILHVHVFNSWFILSQEIGPSLYNGINSKGLYIDKDGDHVILFRSEPLLEVCTQFINTQNETECDNLIIIFSNFCRNKRECTKKKYHKMCSSYWCNKHDN